MLELVILLALSLWLGLALRAMARGKGGCGGCGGDCAACGSCHKKTRA